MITRRSLLPLMATASLIALMAVPVAAQDASPSSAPPTASGAGGPTITVVGTDYHFAGLPTTVPAGTVLAFDNQGDEVHELLIARKNDGVTQSFEELLQLSDEDAGRFVTIVGGMPLFAGPGEMAEGSLTIPAEGEYIALCFVPQGMTEIPDGPPDPSATPGGPPHFVLGMLQTFTATAVGTEPGPLPSEMPMDETPEDSPAP